MLSLFTERYTALRLAFVSTMETVSTSKIRRPWHRLKIRRMSYGFRCIVTVNVAHGNMVDSNLAFSPMQLSLASSLATHEIIIDQVQWTDWRSLERLIKDRVAP